MPSFRATLLPTLALAAFAAAYQWPDQKYEELEHLLVDNRGFNDALFSEAVTPCTRYVHSPLNTTGRQTSAQWQRVMFHDLSTANIHTGIGGIDASIGFETHRPENKGAAMNDTLGWYSQFYNKHVPMADMIALGTIMSSAACSGPIINFKAGRVDARDGGAFGVPDPDISAEEFHERMERVGYNKTEGIQFVACGHTIGAVHTSGFPEVQSPELISPTNTNGGQSFDDTIATFDNHVAQQYIAGTTKNPLVVSFNVTNRSDKRIYESDGNKTIAALASSNDLFMATCLRIYEKAINTVPRGIQLSDVKPIAVKPVNVALDFALTGAATFRGSVRLLGSQFEASTSRKVVVAWKGTDNKEYTTTASAAVTGWSIYLQKNNLYHSFSATLAANTGVSSFVIRVTENGKTTTYDNNGARYSFTDVVQFQPKLSSFTIDAITNKLRGTIVAAVRKAPKPQSVVATLSIPVHQVGTLNPTIQTLSVPLTLQSSLGKSGYELWTASQGELQLLMGVNITLRSRDLAKQATLDITASLPGQKSFTDSFRKVSEVPFNLL